MTTQKDSAEVTTPLADVEGSQELKPCPFCGAEAVLGEHSACTVRCTNLDCFMHPIVNVRGTLTKSQIVRAWNTRSSDASSDNSALGERVNKVIKEIRQQQTRPVSFWTDDLIQLIRDLHKYHGTEQTMHQAWRKRAEETEADASGYVRGLDCAMCNTSNSFVISPIDPAVGYCFKEQRAWRVTSTTCVTEGCLRPKATFGDHCMPCLEDRVNSPDALISQHQETK